MTDSKIQPPPLSTYFAQHGSAVAAIELVATDVDGTLTRDGALTAASLGAIEELTAAGLEVVPVSGRPAGEVLGLCRYLPGVRRAIAENGLISVVPDQPVQFIGRPTNPARLREVGDALNADHGANLRLAGDEFCRVGDVAYERAFSLNEGPVGDIDAEFGTTDASDFVIPSTCWTSWRASWWRQLISRLRACINL